METTLIRVLELTPGLATPPLPRYGTLYPQETGTTPSIFLLILDADFFFKYSLDSQTHLL